MNELDINETEINATFVAASPGAAGPIQLAFDDRGHIYFIVTIS